MLFEPDCPNIALDYLLCVYCKICGVMVTPKCGVKSQCKNDASNSVSIDTKVMVSIKHHVSLHITHSSWHHRKFPTTLSMST